ncbi:DUF6659 family protein [Nitrososphaera sp.]|uniref:DUF6659 family protein n=1 Tax=Nitrososphaera sp. TaxID=1971748 RepID=UPI00307EFD97
MAAGKKKQDGSSRAELCSKVFAIDPAVRFAGVIDKMGKLVAGGMREGLRPLESVKDMDRLYLEFALRNAMRREFDAEFGPTIYAMSEREKIKIATFPMPGEELLLISIDRSHPHDRIISRILELLR